MKGRRFCEGGAMKLGFVKGDAMNDPRPPIGQQAGSTHPTGMHSSLSSFQL